MAESLGSVTISISEYNKLRQSQKIVDGELFIKINYIGQRLGIYSTSDNLIKLAQST